MMKTAIWIFEFNFSEMAALTNNQSQTPNCDPHIKNHLKNPFIFSYPAIRIQKNIENILKWET